MKTVRRPVAIWLVNCANAILPAGMRQWGYAMQCEELQASGDNDAIAFAWGCFTTSLRITASYYIIEPMTRLLNMRARRSWYVYVFAALLAGLFLMLPTTMTLNDTFTGATLVFAVLKIVPILILGMSKNKVLDLFASPIHAMLYFTSKVSGVLTVAFALAAAASAGKTVETYVLAGVLLVATALTFWTIFARFTGRFYGFAQIGRPA
jgi:hypothetical protein